MNYLRDLPVEYLEHCPVIDGKYKVLFKLGTGRFSKVKMALNLATNERVAIKIMNQKIQIKDMMNQNNQTLRGQEQKKLTIFLNEIKTCLQARHRNIIQILDFNIEGIYLTSQGISYKIMYYVMKIAQNGQLFRLISQTQPFPQKTAKQIFHQLIYGLRYLHSKGYGHCDIKAENILLDEKMNIKIVDFGFCRLLRNQSKVKINYNSQKDFVGTVKSNPPELTINNIKANQSLFYHADQVDVFAAGCLLFELVMKCQPFKVADMKDQCFKKLVNQHQKNSFWQIFSGKCKPSSDFKDLIQKLLHPIPQKRLTMNEILQHPWLINGSKNNKQQYQKQLNSRLKKVFLKVRKQQQTQIKKFFTKQRNNNKNQLKNQSQQLQKIQSFQIYLATNKQLHEKIRIIRHQLIKSNKRNQAGTDSSSNYSQVSEDQLCPENNNYKQNKICMNIVQSKISESKN